jgi:acyl-ACP thioesterase
VSGTYREVFRIRAHEIALGRHLSIPALLDDLQDAAGVHADLLGASVERMAEHGLGWVLHHLRLELDATLPKMGLALEVETWPSASGRVYAHRDFELRSDGRLLGRASEAWVVVDLRARRVTRIPAFVREIRLPDRPPTLPQAEPSDALTEPWIPGRTGELETSFEVRLHDLDQNGHTNHVRYVEWALEALPRPVLIEQDLGSLEVVFLAEALERERLRSVAAPTGEGGFVHRIVRDDGVELARLSTRWNNRSSS